MHTVWKSLLLWQLYLLAEATSSNLLRQEQCVYGPNNDTCYLQSCTFCDENEGCLILPNFCLINGNCVDDGHIFQQHNGLSFCQICDTNRSVSQYSPAPTGSHCEDGIFCNGADTCVYDAEKDYSYCDVHKGDPCAGQGACNNTCSEGEYPTFEKTCHVQDKTTCAEDTACASFQCLSGSCSPIPVEDGLVCDNETTCSTSTCQLGECKLDFKEDYTVCGDGTDCMQDICLTGTCERHRRDDGTSCGTKELCSEDICVSGSCVTRMPSPRPVCNECPCDSGHGDGEYCNTTTGMCYDEKDEPDNSDNSHSDSNDFINVMAHAMYVLLVVACVFLVVGAYFVVRIIYRRHQQSEALFEPLTTDDESYAKKPFLTRYIKEDEKDDIPVINKKL